MRLPFRRRRRPARARRSSQFSRVNIRYDRLRSELAVLNAELPEPPGAEAMTASGTLIRHGQATYLRRLIMPWQIRAFGFYDLLGEIKYASQFYSRSLANLVLFAAEMNDDGEIVPTDDEEVKDAVARIKDPGGGGRAGLLAAYGRLIFLVGEALLFVSIDRLTELEQWEMLSTDELRVLDGNYTRFMAPTLPAMLFKPAPDDAFEPVDDDTAVAYRLHRPHPRFSALPDSTLEGALDICVARGTMVSTPTGARKVEDVVVGDDVYAWRDGEMVTRRVAASGSTGENETLLVTAGRRTIRCTPTHRLLVARRTSPGKGHPAAMTTEWVRARDLAEGDLLVAADRIPSQPHGWTLPDGTRGTSDIAYLLGQVCGDGHVTRYTVSVATFNAARDAELARIVGETWGLEPRRRGAGSIAWHSVALVRLMQLLGLRCPAPEKSVPPIVWQMPDVHKRAFLRGYEDADGHLTPQGWQSHATSSERLARELRHLYIELGENASNLHVEERPDEMWIAGNDRVTTRALPLQRFQVYYGSRRRGMVKELKTEAQRAVVGQSFTLARVKSVTSAGVTETFDLAVPDAECFIADGVVSHNCEELVLLTQVVRARARSRMATAGILFVDDRITTRPDEPVPDEDALEDPFIEDLTEALTAPITDEGTASAVVPLLARVKVPEGMKMQDLVYHLQIVDPLQIYPETGLRMECIKRLAIVLDMPPEVLLGVATVNHWGAWMVDEQSWKVHLQPVAEGLVQDLTSAYLQPYLKQQGKEGWDRFYVGYDASAVINHPDRTKDAKELHDRAVIGDEALRDAAGFDEDDAPTEEERARIIGMAVRDSSLAWDGIPSVKAGGIEPEPGEIVQADGTAGAKAGPSTGAEVEQGPPPGGPPAGDESIVGSIMAAQIEGVAQAALIRARDAAGAKLRTSCRRDDEALRLIDGRGNREVAALLGRSRVRALGASEDDLVAGARDLIVETLRVFGIEDPEVAALIATTIERHAARTLYEPRLVPLPASFPGYVRGLLAHGKNGSDGEG